jgi:hypothetical protein
MGSGKKIHNPGPRRKFSVYLSLNDEVALSLSPCTPRRSSLSLVSSHYNARAHTTQTYLIQQKDDKDK